MKEHEGIGEGGVVVDFDAVEDGPLFAVFVGFLFSSAEVSSSLKAWVERAFGKRDHWVCLLDAGVRELSTR